MSTSLPVLFVRPRLTRMSLFVLLADIWYSKSSCPAFFPRSVTVTNDPRLFASFWLIALVTVQPDASPPGRKWASLICIGVPLTDADHRHATGSTVTVKFFVSTVIGGAACAGARLRSTQQTPAAATAALLRNRMKTSQAVS